MSLRHPATEAWEKRLRDVFHDIDRRLEARYGSRLARDPRRPAAGVTSSHEADGIFNVGAAYSPGFGSRHGAGYVVEIGIRSVRPPPPALREEIERAVVRQLRLALPRAFPGRRLEVIRDGSVWKIVGDLSLGRA